MRKNKEKIDVYSKFSEDKIEFVSEEDESEVLEFLDSYAEFNNERKSYD